MSLQKRINRLEQNLHRQHPTGQPTIDEAWQAATTVQEKARVVLRKIDELPPVRPDAGKYDDMTAEQKRQLYEQRIRSA